MDEKRLHSENRIRTLETPPTKYIAKLTAHCELYQQEEAEDTRDAGAVHRSTRKKQKKLHRLNEKKSSSKKLS